MDSFGRTPTARWPYLDPMVKGQEHFLKFYSVWHTCFKSRPTNKPRCSKICSTSRNQKTFPLSESVIWIYYNDSGNGNIGVNRPNGQAASMMGTVLGIYCCQEKLIKLHLPDCYKVPLSPLHRNSISISILAPVIRKYSRVKYSCPFTCSIYSNCQLWKPKLLISLASLESWDK